MPDTYWVRDSKKTYGPFSASQFEQLIAQGKVKATHQISTDKEHWFQAETQRDKRNVNPEAQYETATNTAASKKSPIDSETRSSDVSEFPKIIVDTSRHSAGHPARLQRTKPSRFLWLASLLVVGSVAMLVCGYYIYIVSSEVVQQPGRIVSSRDSRSRVGGKDRAVRRVSPPPSVADLGDSVPSRSSAATLQGGAHTSARDRLPSQVESIPSKLKKRPVKTGPEDSKTPSPPKSLVSLVAGEPISAKTVTLHHAVLEMDGHKTPARGAGLTIIQIGGVVEVEVQAIHLISDEDQPSAWQYELRPVGPGLLQVDIVMKKAALLGHLKFGIITEKVLWKDQPYEVVSREGIVVYAYPTQDTIGQKRSVAVVPNEGQFLAE